MIGKYRIDEHAEHPNDVHKQYNSKHVHHLLHWPQKETGRFWGSSGGLIEVEKK